MFVEMYGIDCAFCGQAVWAWVRDRMWPCSCPAPDLGPGVAAPTALPTQHPAQHPTQHPAAHHRVPGVVTPPSPGEQVPA